MAISARVHPAKLGTDNMARSSQSALPANDQRWNVPSIIVLILVGALPYLVNQYLWKSTFVIQGIQFDAIDVLLVLFGIIVGLSALSRQANGRRFSEVPHFRLWVLYGSLVCIGYTKMALELGYFSDPFRIVYQFYRYCWRTLLFYPLVAMLFREEHRLKLLVFTLVFSADVSALIYIWYARSSIAFFMHKNEVGAFLLLPGLFALALGLYSRQPREKKFYRMSFITHLAALWYTQSRGAVVGFFVGLTCFGILDSFLYKKKCVSTMILSGLLIVSTIMLVKPDIGQESGIRASYLGLDDPTEVHTFQWRLQYIWPHFLEIALSNPIFGVGRVEDPTLGTYTNTPHNGYLAIAVQSGIPSLLVFLSFLLITIREALFLIKNGKNDFYCPLGMGIMCGILALSVHNMVDSSFLLATLAPWLWVVLALSASLGERFRSQS